MKSFRFVGILLILLASMTEGITQETLPRLAELSKKMLHPKELRDLPYTKLGKKLIQVWDQVWGGEREKQRREKYPTLVAYAHRPLDPDEQELIAEMLEFAKGWRILEKERGIQQEDYPGERETWMEIYSDKRIEVLHLLREVKHVSMIDGLVDILWDMPPKLKEAIAQWLSGELEKEIEREMKITDELIQKWRKKGLSEEEATNKGMEEFHRLYRNRKSVHPMNFVEVRVMEEVVETLASIPDDRTMDELLRLLDHPLPTIVMTAVQAIGLLRGEPRLLFVWLREIQPEEKGVPWYTRKRWEWIRKGTEKIKKGLIEWWQENRGKVRLHWELTQKGLPEVLW